MGYLFQDNNQGIHAEARRESFVLYKDFGEQRIELSYNKLPELKMLIEKIEASQSLQHKLPGFKKLMDQTFYIEE